MKRFSLRALFLGFAMLGLFLTASRITGRLAEPIRVESDRPDCLIYLDDHNLGATPAQISHWDLFRLSGRPQTAPFTSQSFRFSRFGSFLNCRAACDHHCPLVHLRLGNSGAKQRGQVVESHLGQVVEVKRIFWRGNTLVLHTEDALNESLPRATITRAVPSRNGHVKICMVMPIATDDLLDQGVSQIRVMMRVGNFADGNCISRYETIDLATLPCQGELLCYETDLGGRRDDVASWIDGAVTTTQGDSIPGLAAWVKPVLLTMVDQPRFAR